MTRLPIIPGLSAPFYPMRPYRGMMLMPSTVELALAKLKAGDTVQRKLNGDRASLVVLGGQVRLFNRHGGAYSHAVTNGRDFLQFGDRTVLDGEVWQSKIYPFECLVYKGLSLIEYGPKAREECAKQVCEKVGLPWLFEVSEAWLRAELTLKHDLRSRWEGIVIKAKDSPYQVLGSESQESSAWAKWKFVCA